MSGAVRGGLHGLLINIDVRLLWLMSVHHAIIAADQNSSPMALRATDYVGVMSAVLNGTAQALTTIRRAVRKIYSPAVCFRKPFAAGKYKYLTA